MKSLAISGTTLLAMTTSAMAKTHGMPGLDSITGIFSSIGNNGSWLVIAAIAFVVYIAGSAHRA